MKSALILVGLCLFLSSQVLAGGRKCTSTELARIYIVVGDKAIIRKGAEFVENIQAVILQDDPRYCVVMPAPDIGTSGGRYVRYQIGSGRPQFQVDVVFQGIEGEHRTVVSIKTLEYQD